MLIRKYTFLKAKAITIALAMILSACASKNVSDDQAPELATSEADIANDESGALSTDVFSDLNKESNGSSSGPTLDNTEAPFYNTIGGESLGRIAYTLYGKASFKKKLSKLNPNISSTGKLEEGRQVFFEFEGLNPQPKMLTKDLLGRYTEPLANSLMAKSGEAGLVKTSVTVNSGETLQSIATKLYGSSRYWTEIYLLNHAKLNNYDRIKPGDVLDVYERAAGAPVLAAAGNQDSGLAPIVPGSGGLALDNHKKEVIRAEVKEESTVKPIPTAPVNTMTTQPVVDDPISPTISEPAPEATQPVQASAPVNIQPVAEPVAETIDQAQSSGQIMDTLASTNVRRGLYLGLVIMILAAAFFMTKQKKKPKNFDMLDSTTQQTTTRSKLGGDKDKFVG